MTGKVEQGEPYPVGALREAIEETSLKIEWIVHFIDLNLAHNFIDERKRNVHEKSYLCLIDRTFDVTIDPHEHMAFRWKQKILRSDVKHLGNFEALECAQKLILENFT